MTCRTLPPASRTRSGRASSPRSRSCHPRPRTEQRPFWPRSFRPAATPISPTTPKTALNLALGLLLGLLLGAGQAVLREVLDTRVRTEHDITRVTESPVIGSVMFDASLVGGPFSVVAEPRSLRAESYRRLRTNLQFLGLKEDQRAVVITSTVSGEGKTTTAINIAVTMAAAGERVLLT